MRVVKKFFRDERTELVSSIFDNVIRSTTIRMPFERLEFHVRDSDVSVVDGDSAMICVDYNNPLVKEKDVKGIDIMIRHELFRLMFKFDLPKPVEDIVIGREMARRGLGDDLFYMYYNYMMCAKVQTPEDYVKLNIPWIIFKEDSYNSDFMKRLASKLTKRKFPEAKRLLDLLCSLSPKNIHEAVEEYKKVVG